MKPIIFLRIASVLTFIHCVLHTVGGVFGKPRNGPEEIAVVEMMKSHRFNTFGSMRSYWDYLFGYGLFVTITLLVCSIFFWQLGTFSRTNPAWMRPVLAVFCFNFAAMSVVSWRYFFGGPAITEALIALFLLVALATAETLTSAGPHAKGAMVKSSSA